MKNNKELSLQEVDNLVEQRLKRINLGPLVGLLKQQVTEQTKLNEQLKTLLNAKGNNGPKGRNY